MQYSNQLYLPQFQILVASVTLKNFIFFAKHSKGFKKQYSESKPHGEYAEPKAVNYIFENNVLTKLATKKSFLEYFLEHKKDVKKYMKKNKLKYKKANSGELYKLLKYCNEIRIP